MKAFFKSIKTHPLALGSVLTIFVLSIVAICSPWLTPYPPNALDITQRLCLPSFAHWMGCDPYGADVFSQMIAGTRVSLMVAFTTIIIIACSGTAIGLLSGYYGGTFDLIIMRICDIFLAFPGLLLAIAIAAMLGPSATNLILALSATGWVSFARLVRGEVLVLKEQEFVLAARAVGASDISIMGFHILPNALSPIIVQATFGLAGIIIAESSLSFLGLGVPVETPSWGKMLDSGRDYLLSAPRLSMYPGFAIMLVCIAFNFIGDAIREFVDPQGRRGRIR